MRKLWLNYVDCDKIIILNQESIFLLYLYIYTIFGDNIDF